MRRSIMCRKLICLISFVVLASSAFAAEYHVGTAYRETTVEAAYALVTSGDTITVHAGTYTLDTTGTYKTDDSIHNLTIRAAAGEHVVMDVGFNYMRYHSGWTIDGLVFNKYSYDTIVLDNDMHDFTVKNCIFSNSGSQDIYCYDTEITGTLTIENCTFYNNSSNDAIRIKRTNGYTVIEDCLFVGLRHIGDPSEHWVGKSISCSTFLGTIVSDYCSFWDNANDHGSSTYYGTMNTSDHSSFTGPSEAINFLNTTNAYAADFLYQSMGNAQILKAGDSDGSYRGARPTPEPATVALLGLGGLVLLRRKR
jgi:hypothetical protein